MQAIIAYAYLHRALKIELASQQTSSLLISLYGFFNLPKKRRIDTLKEVVRRIEIQIRRTYAKFTKEEILADIPHLPSCICKIVPLPVLDTPQDRFGNTLLHQLAKNREFSAESFQSVLEDAHKFLTVHNKPKSTWHSYINHRNKEGQTAAQIAFSAQRLDIHKLLMQYNPQPESKPPLLRRTSSSN